MFGGGTQLPAGTAPSSIVVADIDGDSDLDLLVPNFYSSDIFVPQNNGNGTFGSATILVPGTNPNGIATADVDGDGDLDTLAANFSSNDLSVFINQPPPLQGRITGDSGGCAGQPVSLLAIAPAARSYRWSTGATTAGISVTQPTQLAR